MSVFTFAQAVTNLGYIYNDHLEFLCKEHHITMEEAITTMKKLGFDKEINNV